MSFSTITVVGNATKAPELREVQARGEKKKVCSVNVAVNDPFDKESTTFFQCDFWDKQAETAAKYVGKGHKVGVYNGRLSIDEWTDSDGNTRSTFKIQGGRLALLQSKPSEDGPVEDPFNF